jgi:hypothetical protein
MATCLLTERITQTTNKHGPLKLIWIWVINNRCSGGAPTKTWRLSRWTKKFSSGINFTKSIKKIVNRFVNKNSSIWIKDSLKLAIRCKGF